MRVIEFLRENLFNESMNAKSIFTVYFNKKYYSCNLQELNMIWGNNNLEWCYKKGKNWFQVKIA